MVRVKYFKYAISGILVGIFIVPIVFNWLAIPLFDQVLYMLFGEPDNPLSISLAIIFTLGIITLAILLPISRKKADT